MKEGGLDAPQRVPLNWQDEAFYDPAALDAEMRRVFDICHGCRRCFNLCDSFPRLFDLIDKKTEEGEVAQVKSEDFAGVVEACTLCDMCFMTKCPYVPPHPFNLDFPHLMLRARAVEERRGEVGFVRRQLIATDRNGRLFGLVAPLVNWATATGNRLTRALIEAVAGVHRLAELPRYHFGSFLARARARPPERDAAAPASGRKAVLYATCFVNYNNPGIGEATQAVLARNGVETEVIYPECCGMPQLEMGDLGDVAARARRIAAVMKPWIEKGYAVIALVPSCALMLRSEWPLLVPDDADVIALAKATRDVSEYVMEIAGKEGLAPGLAPVEGGAWLQLSCHARAQNMGAKAAEMLRLIPGFQVGVIERCSGRGGSWGVMKENFEVALKNGKPVARQVAETPRGYVASECPLAADHIVQGARLLDPGNAPARSWHPIEILARAYRPAEGEDDAMSDPRTLTHAELMPVEDYAKRRWEFRRELADLRRVRRLEVGPFLTLSFECFRTMWHQVQEMLYIEKGGDAQIDDELAAYNPLIPKGDELVATMMLEIDDPGRRDRLLPRLGGIERAIELRFAGLTVASRPEEDVERTTGEGKTSSVHFLHFGFTPAQRAAFAVAGTEVVVAVTHPEYRHMTVLPEATRAVLAGDFAG